MFPGHALSDDILYARAKIATKKHDYSQAANYLQEIIGKFGTAHIQAHKMRSQNNHWLALEIVQVLTPDHLRGRMTGVNMIFFLGGPQLGELEAGLVASAFGVPFAIVSGGLATVLLTGWGAGRYPKLRAYEASHGIIT